jgi:hypothetical protein
MVTRVTDLSLTTDSFPKPGLQGLRGLQTIRSIPTAFINEGYKGYDWLQMVTRVTDLSLTTDSFPKSGLQRLRGLQTIRSIPDFGKLSVLSEWSVTLETLVTLILENCRYGANGL